MLFNALASPGTFFQYVFSVLITVVAALVICDYAFAVVWSWFDLDENRGNESLDIELCQLWEKDMKKKQRNLRRNKQFRECLFALLYDTCSSKDV